MIFQAATLLYGAVALILSFLLAWITGSWWGMASIVVASGLTYVFQAMQIMAPPPRSGYEDNILTLLWIIIVSLVVASWVFVACA